MLRLPLSIDSSSLHSAQQQTCCTLRLNDRTDRQTDAEMDVRPFHRPCSTYYATSVNNAMKVIIPVKDINRLENIHRLKTAAWPSLSLIVTGSLFHMSGPQTEKVCWCNWVLARQTIADLGADDHSWWRWDPLMWRYDTIRDAILTCAQKLTQVSLIYCTEPKTKKWGKELKSKNGCAQKYR